MKCVLYEKIQPELVYAIAKKEESRRERRSSVNAACCSISRAFLCLVMCCKCTKPCDIKSFHVGSVFELDVVQSSGLVWARLGGSSSRQILREAVFVLQALQFYLQRKPQAWSVACVVIPSDMLAYSGQHMMLCLDDTDPHESTSTTEPQHKCSRCTGRFCWTTP